MVRRAVLFTWIAVCGFAVATLSARQSVDDVIAKNLEAKGGLTRLKAIQTVKQTTKMTMQGMEASMVIYSKRPNRLRQEIKVAGQSVINGFDGVTPWIVNPMAMGGQNRAIAVSGPQADMLRDQSDFDGPLVDYKTKGFTVSVKDETLGDLKVHHLQLVSPNRQVTHFYINAATNLEVKRTIEIETQKLEQEFSDYRTVDGITLPFTIRMLTNGNPQSEMKVQSVEFNVQLDDAIFRMPRG